MSVPEDTVLIDTLAARVPADALMLHDQIDAALDRVEALYDASIARVAAEFDRYAAGATDIDTSAATYPYLGVVLDETDPARHSDTAFGKVSHTGLYGATLTQPALFRDYLAEQMALILRHHGGRLFTGASRSPLPLSFALEQASADLPPDRRRALVRHFHMPPMAETHDDLADGLITRPDEHGAPNPLSLFSAERVDYSLHRLRHYTATAAEHFQGFVLFTNYQRYVDEFIAFAHAQVAAGRYERFVEPGNRVSTPGAPTQQPPLAKAPPMPAYHLVAPEGMGITLINIGMGPSNAKTMTDHLAVLRPHVWLMIGHCGGLRASQQLGDYVLAHAYLRDDHVLDSALPVEIPLPTLAEVQVALADAVSEVTGLSGAERKQRLRTGTVVTTDDRNWELRYDELARRFNQSRAIAIDMESATIAANGYRFRVPYGTLLCVSDRPLHGEIKLPGMANAFYEARVSQHLDIGLRAVDLLRQAARDGTLHSRKLRSFLEPPFR